jgi:hypothetical protein
MLLVPEDVYTQLLASSAKVTPTKPQIKQQKPENFGKTPKTTDSNSLVAKHNVLGEGDLEDLPIDESQRRLTRLVKQKGLSDEAKNIKYQQEFKRLNRMVESKRERPVKTQAVNLPQLSTSSNVSSHAPTSTVARSNRSSSVTSSQQSSVAYEQKVQNVIDYLRTDPPRFSLNSNLSVVTGNRGSPLKNSSAKRIVEYILSDPPSGSRPPGYHIFVKQIMKDDFLKQQLLTPEFREMYRKLMGKGAKMNIKSKRPPPFRPKLW